jgi:hypothetical protein
MASHRRLRPAVGRSDRVGRAEPVALRRPRRDRHPPTGVVDLPEHPCTSALDEPQLEPARARPGPQPVPNPFPPHEGPRRPGGHAGHVVDARDGGPAGRPQRPDGRAVRGEDDRACRDPAPQCAADPADVRAGHGEPAVGGVQQLLAVADRDLERLPRRAARPDRAPGRQRTHELANAYRGRRAAARRDDATLDGEIAPDVTHGVREHLGPGSVPPHPAREVLSAHTRRREHPGAGAVRRHEHDAVLEPTRHEPPVGRRAWNDQAVLAVADAVPRESPPLAGRGHQRRGRCVRGAVRTVLDRREDDVRRDARRLGDEADAEQHGDGCQGTEGEGHARSMSPGRAGAARRARPRTRKPPLSRGFRAL